MERCAESRRIVKNSEVWIHLSLLDEIIQCVVFILIDWSNKITMDTMIAQKYIAFINWVVNVWGPIIRMNVNRFRCTVYNPRHIIIVNIRIRITIPHLMNKA